jgi:Zn-dependent protease/predicted transcriptional regulator
MKSTWRIGRIFGIDINIDSSWLIIFALVIWTLAGSYFPQQYPRWPTWLHWAVGVVTSICAFGSVLGHELAHSLVAISQGETVRSITLFIFGGVATISEEPDTPLKELLMAIVGPLFSMAIGMALGILWFLSRGLFQPLGALARYLAVINVSLALFNLTPGFPLDGGRVLRALIWGLSGNLRLATRLASWAGQGISGLFILAGAWQVVSGRWLDGLWIVFIGWFLFSAATSGYRQVLAMERLREVRVGDLMSADFVTVSGDITLEELVDGYARRYQEHSFAVADAGLLRGIISLHDIKAVPRARFPYTRVSDVMTPWEKLEAVSPGDFGSAVLARLNARGVRQLPVVEGERLVGLLSRSDVLRYAHLRTARGT